MEFIRGAHNIGSRHRGCVVSIGNYDGLHLGHRQVIRKLVELGRRNKLPVTIIGFEPHPVEFFVPDSAPARLMSIREKIEGMTELEVDRFCCLRFNRALANTEPEDFVENLLIRKLGARHIVVGDDFRFGRNRRGDFHMLHALCMRHGVHAVEIDPQNFGNERISSSRIRRSLASGNLTQAKRLLGREYSISGRVVRGDGNGAKWGFATANIRMNMARPALKGVFVTEVDLVDGSSWHAVASLGMRPTVGGTQNVLEVHLLDFDSILYGQRIKVRFIKKLRDEVKFSSIETMCDQIRLDILRSREFFGAERSRVAS